MQGSSNCRPSPTAQSDSSPSFFSSSSSSGTSLPSLTSASSPSSGPFVFSCHSSSSLYSSFLLICNLFVFFNLFILCKLLFLPYTILLFFLTLFLLCNLPPLIQPLHHLPPLNRSSCLGIHHHSPPCILPLLHPPSPTHHPLQISSLPLPLPPP